VLGTQLGTPRGRYEEHSSKFPSVVKPRVIEPVGESQTSEVMLASLVTLRTIALENAGA
jgi:hypothetical protein